MWIALGLLLPIVLLVAVCAAEGKLFRQVATQAWVPRAVASAAAIWIFVAMASLIAGGNRWPRTTQIAWTGIDRLPSASTPGLTIGGSEQDGVVGWPNGTFAPMIHAEPAGTNALKLTIGRGGGFVRSLATNELLNGLPLPEDHARIVDDYRFELVPKYWPLKFWPFPYQLRVFARDDTLLADATLTRSLTGYRYVSLEYLNTRSSQDVKRNAVYENWSRPVFLAVARKGIRILERKTVATAQCASPCVVAVKWRRGTLLTTFFVDPNATVHAQFQRPWRRVSPIPETTPAGREIVVTREAQPGDYAFILPLGGGYADPRTLLRLEEDQSVARFAGATAPAFRAGEQLDGGVVTSRTAVRSGDYAFAFATAVDVLHPGVIVVRLLIAAALVIVGLMLFGARVERSDQWLVGGIAIVLFALLTFRVALAVRYAAAPEFLDQIAIKGVVLSLIAVTAVPAVVLLESRLRDDASRPPLSRGQADRATKWAVGYLAAIAVAVIYQLRVAGDVWPSVPRALVPSPQFALAVLAILVIISIHVAVMIWRAYVSHLRPKYSYEHFGEATAGFWRTVADGRQLRGLRWYFGVVGVVLVFLLALAILRFIPGERGVQEIAAPLILTLLPSVLWLSAGVYMSPSRRRQGGWLPSPRLLFWAAVTVGVPAVVIPAIIGDPGSLLATASVFFPVALVLLMSDRGRKASVAVFAALLSAWGLAFLLYLNWERLYTTATKVPGSGNVPARLLVFKRQTGIQENILLTSQALEDAAQHTWQNQAIAHEGSWLGLGYGNAPTRRSQVAQDTLQFDSVFSFFIFSEHGLLGAGALILLYTAPLLLFLLTRNETTLANAVGTVIAAAFFGEAWFHAAMNLGVWPFAGRNLPLLSVNSGTDATKWLLLFVIAASTPFWRRPSQRAPRDQAPIVVSSPRYAWFTRAFAGAVAVFFCLILYAGVRNVRDPRLAEPFTWDSILGTVQRFVADGTLTLDKNNNIVPRGGVALTDSLLTHQIEAFNQLPLDQKTGESAPAQLLGRIFSVTNANAFEQVLREEASKQIGEPRPRPPLFRLAPLPVYADEQGFVPIVGPRYAVQANPEFNMRVSFHELQTRESIPNIRMSEQQIGSYTMQGSAFTLNIPRRFHRPYESRAILLSPSGEAVDIAADSNPSLSRGEVTLRIRGRRGWMLHPFIRFDVTEDGLLFLDNHPRGFRLRLRRAERDLRVVPGQRVQLFAGDRVDLAYDIGIDPGFAVSENDPAPIVGPAWVMGRWIPAYDRRSALPWTPHLATALEREWERLGPAAASEQYKTLTFDLPLQQAAQDFVAQRGRALHDIKLMRFAIRRNGLSGAVSAALLRTLTTEAQPPRVALTVLALPTGDVLALAGWPRMNSGRIGGPCTAVDVWCPPSSWIDESAPSFVRTRYGGDRNFDRIEMGSSTKPLFAAAALSVHPGLDGELHVTGPAGVESEVFGIPLPGRTGWQVLHGSAGWVDFNRYLAISDNRYQVRLGFLALADKTGGRVQADSGQSPSTLESMDGRSPWHRYPLFPPAMQFSYRRSETMQRIDDSPFARELRSMFGIGVKQGAMRARRTSFWTANAKDDEFALEASPDGTSSTSHPFDAISPEIADLAFDLVSSPRAYVSLLLGGNENRWSNVDFAGAFATAVTGNPVVPHVLKLAKPFPAPPERKRFANIATHLRPGLQDVVISGTAAFARPLLLPPAISQIANVKVYAKTGTLAVGEGATTTSRLVITYIRWADEPRGLVNKGIVLSLVAQDAQMGSATQWLGEYITANQERIAAYLR
jgi:cell division protein FtsW (lipid II flippase)/cell division protein FtsI/penicillin-binding protein 2